MTDRTPRNDRRTGWMPESAGPVTTLLLRHGDTVLSPEKRFSGLSPVELSDSGVRQAEAAARSLAGRDDIAAIVSSPVRRAWQTTEIVSEVVRRPVHVDDDLRETDFGDWEGLTYAEAEAGWPEHAAAWRGDPAIAPPGGESFVDTLERVRRVRDRLVERFTPGTILLVSHVSPIKTMVVLALQAPPASLHRMFLDSACLSEIDWYGDGAAVMRTFNDTHHLRSSPQYT